MSGTAEILGRLALFTSCAAASTFVSACRSTEQRAADDADATLATVALPIATVRLPAATGATGATRIVVRGDAIDVDQARWWISTSPEMRERAMAVLGPARSEKLPHSRRSVVRLSRGRVPSASLQGGSGFLIPALRDVLQIALANVRATEARDDPTAPIAPTPVLVIAADASTPYGTIARSIYSAGQSEWSRFALAMRARDGTDHAVTIELPGACRPDGDGHETCAMPDVHVGARGIDVVGRPAEAGRESCMAMRALASDAARALAANAPDAGASDAGTADRSDGARGWEDRVVLGTDGACPTLPRIGGRLDVAGLARVARALGRAGGDCRAARLSAGEDTPWRDVAAALETLAGPVDLGVMLAVGRAAACVDGISERELRPRP